MVVNNFDRNTQKKRY